MLPPINCTGEDPAPPATPISNTIAEKFALSYPIPSSLVARGPSPPEMKILLPPT